MSYILIVDDRAGDAEMLARPLRRAGWRVRIRKSIAAARRQMCTEGPALMLLDLMFGSDVNAGYRYLEELGKEGAGEPALPVLVLTVVMDPTVRSECLRAGAKDYIRKFPEPSDLVRQITELIGPP